MDGATATVEQPAPVTADKLLTIAECAAALAVSQQTVKRLIASKRLPAIKIFRCTRARWSDVQQFIAAGTD